MEKNCSLKTAQIFITKDKISCLIQFGKIFAIGMMRSGNSTQPMQSTKSGLILRKNPTHCLKIVILIMRMISSCLVPIPAIAYPMVISPHFY